MPFSTKFMEKNTPFSVLKLCACQSTKFHPYKPYISEISDHYSIHWAHKNLDFQQNCNFGLECLLYYVRVGVANLQITDIIIYYYYSPISASWACIQAEPLLVLVHLMFMLLIFTHTHTMHTFVITICSYQNSCQISPYIEFFRK